MTRRLRAVLHPHCSGARGTAIQSVVLGAGQVIYRGVSDVRSAPGDGFDRWVAVRSALQLI